MTSAFDPRHTVHRTHTIWLQTKGLLIGRLCEVIVCLVSGVPQSLGQRIAQAHPDFCLASFRLGLCKCFNLGLLTRRATDWRGNRSEDLSRCRRSILNDGDLRMLLRLLQENRCGKCC